jgi:spore germination cell wall hydrolase CwlJ-like protein
MKKLISTIALTITIMAPVFGASAKNYSEEQVIASTLYFEARGENLDGKKAVASIIYNRAQEKRWKKLGMKGVCLQPMQFSTFNNGFKMPNPDNIIDKRSYEQCKKIAKQMVNKTFKPTHNANHYVTVKFYKKAKPTHWCKKMTGKKIIDNHIFGRA